MKKVILLLFVLVFTNMINAQDAELEKQLDSTRYALLKPRIENYLVKADRLNEQIRNTSDKDSVHYYAKRLCHLTDSMLVTADGIYGYSSSYNLYSGVGFVGSAPVFISVPVSTVTGIRPSVHDALQKISEASDTMRWFAFSKKGRQVRIEEMMDQLRNY